MLNFAEQTGSGAVMIVWSFLLETRRLYIITFSTLQNLTQYHPSFHPSPGPTYYLRNVNAATTGMTFPSSRRGREERGEWSPFPNMLPPWDILTLTPSPSPYVFFRDKFNRSSAALYTMWPILKVYCSVWKRAMQTVEYAWDSDRVGSYLWQGIICAGALSGHVVRRRLKRMLAKRAKEQHQVFQRGPPP